MWDTQKYMHTENEAIFASCAALKSHTTALGATAFCMF